MNDKTEVECLSRDIALLSTFVHGAEGESVSLGGVPAPTLRTLVSDIRSGFETLLFKLNAYESRLACLEGALAGLTEETVIVDGVAHTLRPIGSLVVNGDIPDATKS